MLATFISIKGIEKVGQILDKKKREVAKRYKDAITKGSVKVVSTAKQIAPIQYGALRANIVWQLDIATLKKIVAKIGVNDIIDYALAVETMHEIGKEPRKPGKKSPYLYPSVIQNQEFIVAQIKEATFAGFKA